MQRSWNFTEPSIADGLSVSVRSTLTRREVEIAHLVSQGLPNKTVASQLGLEVGTVKIHLHKIFRKLGISKRAGLVLGAHIVRQDTA
jgi:DNA-binding NarL/FixJ family response regulator